MKINKIAVINHFEQNSFSKVNGPLKWRIWKIDIKIREYENSMHFWCSSFVLLRCKLMNSISFSPLKPQLKLAFFYFSYEKNIQDNFLDNLIHVIFFFHHFNFVWLNYFSTFLSVQCYFLSQASVYYGPINHDFETF